MIAPREPESQEPRSLDPERADERPRRGGFRPFDVLLGVVLMLALPAVTFFAVRASVPDEPAGPASTLRDDRVPPDAEEVRQKLDYIRSRLYLGNAYRFLERVKGAEESAFEDLRWAKRSLNEVLVRLTDLEALIIDSGASSRFGNELQEITSLKGRVEAGLREVDEADILGVTRTTSEER